MKRFILNIVCIVSGICPMWADADTNVSQYSEIVYVESTSANAGDEVTLSIQLHNTNPVIGYNFKLYLPEGISVKTEVDDFGDLVIDAGLSGNRTSASRHTFVTSLNNEGVLTVLCYSTQTYSFVGNDGVVGYIKVNIDENMAEGVYPIIIREEAISLSNATPQISYIQSSITITNSSPVLLGDVNEDGVVNVMDATMLIGAYLNNNTDQLPQAVADVNHDGIINVMDATEIINIYLNTR